MFYENLGVRGWLHIARKDATGKVVEERLIDNLVTTVGLGFIATRMDGTGSSVMSHMAVGTGTNSPALANTTLQTENARVALDSSTASGVTEVYVATFAAGTGTGALTEAGVLNASSSGSLLCRTTFSVINKGASDSLVITWTITIS